MTNGDSSVRLRRILRSLRPTAAASFGKFRGQSRREVDASVRRNGDRGGGAGLLDRAGDSLVH